MYMGFPAAVFLILSVTMSFFTMGYPSWRSVSKWMLLAGVTASISLTAKPFRHEISKGMYGWLAFAPIFCSIGLFLWTFVVLNKLGHLGGPDSAAVTFAASMGTLPVAWLFLMVHHADIDDLDDDDVNAESVLEATASDQIDQSLKKSWALSQKC